MANIKLGWNQTYEEYVKDFLDKHKNEEPIRKGCKNSVCHCTGECREIVGWRPKHIEPLFPLSK